MAWVLVRYEFPGKRILDALMDVPFALPTAVAGLSLTALFSANGWFGALLHPGGHPGRLHDLGHRAGDGLHLGPLRRAHRPAGAGGHGPRAGTGRRHARRTALDDLHPRGVPGDPAGLARGLHHGLRAVSLGEFGAIVFIAGNLPFRTEIAALLAFIRLEEFDYNGAAAIALVLLAFALVLLLISNLLQFWASRYREASR
jgi:sulfate/thiosulfate transport system permease protein